MNRQMDKRANGQTEGRMDGRTDGQMDRQEFPLCSTGLHPLQVRCPKNGKAPTELPTPLRRGRGLCEVGGEMAEKQLGISRKTPKKQKTQDDGILPHTLSDKRSWALQ